jgi:hypothetical protein
MRGKRGNSKRPLFNLHIEKNQRAKKRRNHVGERTTASFRGSGFCHQHFGDRKISASRGDQGDIEINRGQRGEARGAQVTDRKYLLVDSVDQKGGEAREKEGRELTDAYWEHAEELWAEWRSAGAHRNDSGDPIMPPEACPHGEYWEDCHLCPFFDCEIEECQKEEKE